MGTLTGDRGHLQGPDQTPGEGSGGVPPKTERAGSNNSGLPGPTPSKSSTSCGSVPPGVPSCTEVPGTPGNPPAEAGGPAQDDSRCGIGADAAVSPGTPRQQEAEEPGTHRDLVVGEEALLESLKVLRSKDKPPRAPVTPEGSQPASLRSSAELHAAASVWSGAPGTPSYGSGDLEPLGHAHQVRRYSRCVSWRYLSRLGVNSGSSGSDRLLESGSDRGMYLGKGYGIDSDGGGTGGGGLEELGRVRRKKW